MICFIRFNVDLSGLELTSMQQVEEIRLSILQHLRSSGLCNTDMNGNIEVGLDLSAGEPEDNPP